MSNQWPKKKIIPAHTGNTEHQQKVGWNACHDAFMKVINERQSVWDFWNKSAKKASTISECPACKGTGVKL